MNRMEKILSEMKEQGQKIIVCYYPLCDTLLEDQVGGQENILRMECGFGNGAAI